ncbi:MAG TPA: hypothetical protein VL633_10130 [Bacteroidota bacterium]|jgi:hypothetical protein|nr:hypothetical protein [Bacteroidota bacterium]
MLNSNPTHSLKRWVKNIVVVHLFMSSLVHGQIMNEVSTHLPLPGARAAAMGDAYTAEAPDVLMMYWNPGALPFLEQTSVVFDHYSETPTHVMNDVIAVPVFLTENTTISLGGVLSHIGYITSGQLSGTRSLQFGLSLGYSRILAPGFGVGLTATGVYLDFQGQRSWSGSWMAGLLYTPSPEISYGMVFSDVVDGAQIQRSTRLIQKTLPRRLEIGLSLRYPFSAKRHVVTVSFANEKVFNEFGLLYKAGLEVSPFRFLALRWGYYLTGHDVPGERYGAGIRTDVVQLDYAISPTLRDIQFQQLTLSITFK